MLQYSTQDRAHRNGNGINIHSTLHIIEQTQYRHGNVPVNDALVNFNSPMVDAEREAVEYSALPAFKGDLVQREKAHIRFGVCLSLDCGV